jgi:transcriptional regulator with XRE-family HTH domain
MTNIREIFALNLKKHRQPRGWSQAKLAEKTTSTQYTGMLEIKGKFPSSEMIHKLAVALCIDPAELFFKEIDPEIAIKNSQRAAIEDVGEGFSRILSDFFTKKSCNTPPILGGSLRGSRTRKGDTPVRRKMSKKLHPPASAASPGIFHLTG